MRQIGERHCGYTCDKLDMHYTVYTNLPSNLVLAGSTCEDGEFQEEYCEVTMWDGHKMHRPSYKRDFP